MTDVQNSKCPQCDSTNLESGHVFGLSGVEMGFRPDNAAFLSPSRELRAMACLDCGHVQIMLREIPPKSPLPRLF